MPHNEAFARDFIHNKVPLFVNADRGDDILELGANHGLYTKVFAKQANFVFAWEPHPVNIFTLENNLYGGVEDVFNVTIVERAATDRRGLIKFYDNSANPGGHTMIEAIAAPKTLGHDPNRFFWVIGETIDSYFGMDEASQFVSVRFMKIDIEGGEYHALQGAKNLLRTAKMMILLETHIKIDCKGLYDLVTGLGYEVYNDKWEKVDHVVEDAHYVLTNIGLSPIGM